VQKRKCGENKGAHQRVVKKYDIIHSYIVLAYVVAFITLPEHDCVLCV